MNKLLHIFTFSPVQGFISNSRRLSDLYHSSLLLSTLTKNLMEKLIKDLNTEIIYPVLVEDGQGLANYPNRIVFLADRCMCEDVVKNFQELWEEIYETILRKVLDEVGISKEEKQKIEEQAKLHLENYFRAYCECTNSEEVKKWKEKLKQNLGKDYDDYAVVYDWTERKLGALKSKKHYEPLMDAYTYNGGKHPDGCTLCGERAHLAVDWEKFKKSLQEDEKKEYIRRISHYLKEGEKLCGVCLVKRFAFYYLERQIFPSVHDIANAKFKEELKDFEQKYPDLANRLKSLLKKYTGEEKPRLWEYNAELFDIKELERTKMEEGDPEGVIDNLISELRGIYDKELLSEPSKNYFAIIISDGDSIGDWLGLKSERRKDKLERAFHEKFSKALSNYAREIKSLESKEKFGLRIVYAGGDDVLAVADLREFLDFAEKLNPAFEEKVGENASVSAGIVIGHQKDNLAYLLNEARKAEKKAKSVKGKSAFCITVIPRGGGPVSFWAKWEFLNLFKDTIEYFEKEIIGDRTVYDIKEIASKFEVSEEKPTEIVLALLRGMLKRRVDENKLKEHLRKEKKAFIEEYLQRLRELLEISNLENLANLFYTARFIAKERREKKHETAGANT
ncbi:type III-B CRISPR-associated protein Cas10/Cmr2 [Thermocrinis sp.]|uniref:type III-B CRISPR-associated protein Cas10/Cmr2 n=1 Tax=Thermocrinis sp. TaxID=2024383 RepID=UPI003C0D4BCC